MSILTQLRQAERDRTRFKEIGTRATKSYQELQPKYSQAVQAAKDYQSTLTRDYKQYVQSRNQAVSEYNQLLINRRAALQTALQRQEYLDQLEAAQPELQRQASELYSTYQKNYQDAVSTGSTAYERQLRNIKYARDVTTDQLTRLSPGSSDYLRVQSETDRLAKQLEDLVADTGFVTRFAQSQSAPALQNYQTFVDQTYNPAVREIASVRSSFDLPAASAAFQSTVQDTGYADRASSQAKEVYDASAQRYRELQTGYQQLEQPLSQYATEIKDASEQIKQLNLQIPGLQRSLKVEQDPRKRETRIGYGRSLMTSGTKRRSSVR